MSSNNVKGLSDIGAIFRGGEAGLSVNDAGDINDDGISDIVIQAPYAAYAGATYVVYGQKGGLADINLSQLNATQGFEIFGTSSGLTSSVSGVGDVNADGIDDIIIGDSQAYSEMGAGYVIYGQKGGLASFNISNLTPSQGFTIFGIFQSSFAGASVSGAGDVNADGINDVIIDVPAFGNNVLSATYVIYGQKGGLTNIHLSKLTPAQGFKILPGGANYFGAKIVSGAGDVNSDGIDDIIIGFPTFSYYEIGASYVIYGKKGGVANIHLSNLTASQGFTILGVNNEWEDYTGISVSGAGDVNADGIDDIIIGACPDNIATGFVIYGQKGGVPNIDLSNYNPNQGFEIFGGNYSSCDPYMNSAYDQGGMSVSGAGDVNADGIDDVIIGAPSARYPGASYVIYGQKGGLENIDVRGMYASQGFTIFGVYNDDLAGWSVSGAGDVNDDGIDDIVIGAPGVNSDRGATYVIYGHAGEINNVYLADFQ